MTDERTAPHDLAAEASILGGALLRNSVLARISELEVEDFYDLRHRIVFGAIRALEHRREPIDVVTLEHEIAEQGKLDAIGGVAFLGELALRVPTADNVASYARIVRRLAANRAAEQVLSGALERARRGSLDPFELLSETAGELARLDRLASTTRQRTGRTWDECVEEIEARKDEPWIDMMITGVAVATCRCGSYVPLVAPSGAGKSSLGLQMLVDHALHRGPGIYKTHELDGDEAVARAIGQITATSWIGVLKGEVPRAMVPRVPRLRILERDQATLENLERAVEELRLEFPDEPVFVVDDYLQATPAPPGKERGFVAGVSADLRRAAKRLRVVIMGISQMSTANSAKMRAGELLGIDSSSTAAETAQIERDGYVILTLGDRIEVDPTTIGWKLSTAKYRFGEADVVHDLHYRGRVGTWEVVGEPRRASVVRQERTSEANEKKRAELKRSIFALVDSSPRPMSKNQICELSTGKNETKAAAIKELIAEGVLAFAQGSRKGGHALIWTAEKLAQQEANGAQN